MRLGLNLGYWAGGDGAAAAANLELALEAERLGFSVVWCAEAYGSDAPTVLGYLAARTERIDLGSAVMQIPARTPAMTAMTAATLDLLSGGRFRLGLGVSGPQVAEGWHGVRFDHPLARTREYVDIVRMALARERVAYDGAHFRLPLPDGPGKPLRLMVHPVRPHLPLYLAALGPRNVELAGEIADGWLAMFCSAAQVGDALDRIRAGGARAGRTGVDFDVVVTVPIAIGEDPRRCADLVRGHAALYLGGMGSAQQNFYADQARRLGFADAVAAVQTRFLAGDRSGAAAAVPYEFLDATALLGPPDRITERMRFYSAVGVTTLTLNPVARTLGERLAALSAAAEALRAI